jgi:hypothetical protein
MSCLMYDQGIPDDATVRAAIADARSEQLAVPAYAYDVHTLQGKRQGKTREDFFIDEHDALHPRVAGLFDADLEALRKRKR